MKEVVVLSKKDALDSFDLLMQFQYGNKKESDDAFEKLKNRR